MKIAIAGFSLEGHSTYNFLRSRGHQLTILDQDANIKVPVGVDQVLGPSYLDNLDRFDQIVRTAGLAPDLILGKNHTVKDKITTNLNLFLDNYPSKKLIGITGTKGKGTTSTLISLILEEAGLRAPLGGNIGLPPLDLLPKLSTNSYAVLELSSFQLIDARKSPHIAVCLMVTSEHLDWHANLDQYLGAKANLFKYQSPNDIAIYLANNERSKATAEISPGKKIPYLEAPGAYIENGQVKIDNQTICQVDQLKLLGEHNWQNVCAAVTATWQITKDTRAMDKVLASFSGLEHRLEFVKQIGPISYYDDSFSTTPESTIVALAAIKQPKVIILGGSDKKSDFKELALEITADPNIVGVLLIGQIGPHIAAVLEKTGYQSFKLSNARTVEQVVRGATDLALTASQNHSSVSVLLSPAAASFDMFKDYKDRGERFKSAVQALA